MTMLDDAQDVGPLALKSNEGLGHNALGVVRDPTRAWTLAQRCELAAKCLPKAEYRTRLERLHADMLTEIERVRAALADVVDTDWSFLGIDADTANPDSLYSRVRRGRLALGPNVELTGRGT